MNEGEPAAKCRAVKTGRVDLQCSLSAGHDEPQDDRPATWHESVFSHHEEITYDGARHVVDHTEAVTWEPVDHAAEATRHLMSGRKRSST